MMSWYEFEWLNQTCDRITYREYEDNGAGRDGRITQMMSRCEGSRNEAQKCGHSYSMIRFSISNDACDLGTHSKTYEYRTFRTLSNCTATSNAPRGNDANASIKLPLKLTVQIADEQNPPMMIS